MSEKLKRHISASPRDLPRWLRDLISSPPARGLGLNNWFFSVARHLHSHRSADDIVLLLRAATADQLVNGGEIERQVRRSAAFVQLPAHSVVAPSRAAWPKINVEQREAATSTGLRLVDLWELSPVRFGDTSSHTDEVVGALFPGDPLLCVGKNAFQFWTKPRMAWRKRMGELQFIVPSPMSAVSGLTQDGKHSEHSLSNTGPRRFLVIEQDHGSSDDQAAILLYLATQAPLVLAVYSGGKSIHGWFMAAGIGEQRLRRFMAEAVSLGADPATWTRSQFVRMPDGRRESGQRQTVYFFNPALAS